MKVIRVHNHGGAEVMKLEAAEIPQPGEGELLVRLEAIGLNFIDTYQRSGAYQMKLPFTPGNEGAGVVEEAGAGTGEISKGDSVGYTGVQGAYAEFALIPAERAIKLPEGLDAKMAAAVLLQGMTAHYLCRDTFPLKEGDSCLIHAGAGGVGLLLIQMAKELGATVFTTVSTDEKAELARGAGADHVILYTRTNFEEEILKITAGRKLEVVYDSVGQTSFKKGLNLLKLRGMMALYGQSSGAVPLFDLNELNKKGSLFVTRPSLFHYIQSREELEKRAGAVLEQVSSGRLKVRIGETFPLSKAGEAHQALEGRRTTGKALLIP